MGIVAEHYASKWNFSVLVLERRSHIAGTYFDSNDGGKVTSKYAVNMLHANDSIVPNYLSKFTSWVVSEPTANMYIDGSPVRIPLSIATLNALLFSNVSSHMDLEKWLKLELLPYVAPQNAEDMAKSRVGDRLYQKLFKAQVNNLFGRDAVELDPEIFSDMSIREDEDNRYFQEAY